jgi:hypothetical protein
MCSLVENLRPENLERFIHVIEALYFGTAGVNQDSAVKKWLDVSQKLGSKSSQI